MEQGRVRGQVVRERIKDLWADHRVSVATGVGLCAAGFVGGVLVAIRLGRTQMEVKV